MIYMLLRLNEDEVSPSFHNKLKTTYLDGKVNRRVDFLIDALLRIERDQFFRSMYKSYMYQTNQKELSEKNRHQKSLQIPVNAVEVILCRYLATKLIHILTG